VGVADELPRRGWVLVAGLALAAAAGFFLIPAAGGAVGLTGPRAIVALLAVELVAAAGLAAVYVHYRAEPDGGDDEWRFDP